MSRRLTLAVALALSLLTSSAYDFSRRYELWEDAPLGFSVTACDYSTRGIHVRFETDLPPPYVVGVYRPSEENLGRRCPIAEVETDRKEVFIGGDFTAVAVFVQVMTKGVVERYSDEIGRHMMTKDEWLNYVAAVRNAEPYVNTNANTTFEITEDNHLEIVDDLTWAGFLKTTETNFVFSFVGRKAERDIESIVTNVVQDIIFTNISSSVRSDGGVDYVRTNAGVYASVHLGGHAAHSVSSNDYASGGCFVQDIYTYPQNNDHEQVVTNLNYTNPKWRMVPYEYSFHIRNGKNDRGNGYRIMMFEDSGVCQAQRAYSARTNMSDVVVLPAGFRALSSHDGYIYTTDWEGRRYFQKVTNRTDHVFGAGR